MKKGIWIWVVNLMSFTEAQGYCHCHQIILVKSLDVIWHHGRCCGSICKGSNGTFVESMGVI